MTIEAMKARRKALTEWWVEMGEIRRYWSGRRWLRREILQYERAISAAEYDLLSDPHNHNPFGDGREGMAC